MPNESRSRRSNLINRVPTDAFLDVSPAEQVSIVLELPLSARLPWVRLLPLDAPLTSCRQPRIGNAKDCSGCSMMRHDARSEASWVAGIVWIVRPALCPHRDHSVAQFTGVVLWGRLAGSALPFILRFFKLDPASASAPFVATLVDVTGLIIYFTVAGVVLNGTLL
jgi:hypothetical protein